MDITTLYEIFKEFPQVSTDSRNIQPNSLFFALQGENFDGNQYAESALKNGASRLIIDDEKYLKGDNYILVDDVLKALQALAMHHRRQLSIPVLAITGTNGKTTTKELTRAMLETGYKVTATKGNLNNHIGVPLTVLAIEADTEIAIVEMGANHEGEIRILCEIAQPTLGLITNVGKAHLEGFKDLETIKRTKKELYDYLISHDGMAFIQADDDTLNSMAGDLQHKTYGKAEDAQVRSELINSIPFVKIKLEDELEINTNLTGTYNFENIMAAIAVAKHFNIKDDEIKEALQKYKPENNRSQYILKNDQTFILDAYNANPVSMKVALENFSEMEASHKAVILGDMNELGDSSQEEHEEIIKLISNLDFNKIILVGDAFKAVSGGIDCINFTGYKEAREWLNSNDLEGYAFLIKGSRNMELEKILED
ncbi:MAG: UDP-N-acetylmuramoyl-tripeptide--D-alanyl-D-alanine ligase [Bacteroidetes bacterium]|nr:UDP-N-acetylmuramoyl-tripeptide--D-alanyl-D-alanine ligase [Bacteroidota bacterium]